MRPAWRRLGRGHGRRRRPVSASAGVTRPAPAARVSWPAAMIRCWRPADDASSAAAQQQPRPESPSVADQSTRQRRPLAHVDIQHRLLTPAPQPRLYWPSCRDSARFWRRRFRRAGRPRRFRRPRPNTPSSLGRLAGGQRQPASWRGLARRFICRSRPAGASSPGLLGGGVAGNAGIVVLLRRHLLLLRRRGPRRLSMAG